MEKQHQIPTQKKLINLGEIPDEGQDFIFTQKGGELTKDLKDLVADNDYSYNFFIRPLGNAFEVTGSFSASLPLACSRCAEEYDHLLTEKIHELLIVSEPLGRTGKTPKTPFSNLEESGPFCTELESERFDLGTFARELTVTALPNQPIGHDDCDSFLEKHNKKVEESWQEAVEEDPAAKKNPFDVLKRWKQ